MQEPANIETEIEELLKAAGLALVEFSLSRKGGGVSAKAIVFSPKGTGTAECSAASRIIYPRLQAVFGVEDPYIEVSSPGIDRMIKTRKEYEVFQGKGLKVLLENETEWIRGKILSSTDKELRLETDKGTEVLDLAAVAKARLDSTQEGD